MFMSTAILYDPSGDEGSGPIFLSNVSCNGSEAQLLDCPYEAPDRYCDHSLDAVTYCSLCRYHSIIKIYVWMGLLDLVHWNFFPAMANSPVHNSLVA